MKKKNLWIILIGLGLLNSCLSPKKIIYVNDMDPNINYRTAQATTVTLQKGDRISIKVGSNLVNGTQENPLNLKNNSDGKQSYLIDQRGDIVFPVLGILHIDGLNLEELRELLIKQLYENRGIENAIVQIELLNFKVSILGEVNRVGLVDVPDGRINLLEAISRAGGLTRNADHKRITVIREENGMSKKIVNNIVSKDLFESPAYYLRKNDVIYVEPIAGEHTPKGDRSLRLATIAVGVVSVLLNTISLVK